MIRPKAKKHNTRKLLEEYAKNWQELIDIIPFPVSIVDIEFNITSANKKHFHICRKMGDGVGSKCYELFHFTDRPVKDCPMVKALKSGKPERSEIYEPLLEKLLILTTSPIMVKDSISIQLLI